MKIFGLMFALLFGLMAPAFADTVLDPLHLCTTSGCTAFNGVTIGTPSALSNWGFSSSPPSQSGQLTIDLLVPQNETFTIPTLTQTSGSPLTIGAFTLQGTFSAGQDLTTIAGFSGATPPNPFSAYQPATTALDSGFLASSSYNVYQMTLGGLFTTGTQGGQTSLLNNTFSLSSDVAGEIISGFLNEDVTGGTRKGVFTTAQSSALILGDTPVPTPLPGAFWLLGSGLVGLIGLGSRRKRSSCSILQAV